MGCNYKIYGSITLRRSQEVEVLLDALRERLDDGAVEVETLDENTIDLALNFDDATTIHTPPAMADLFKQMEPFVIGAGSFDIETSGDRWTEYVGTREEVAKARSTAALHLIQEHIELLTAEDRAKLGVTGQVVALQNALGALLGNILPPTAAELKDAQPGSLTYNWQRAEDLFKAVPAIVPPNDEIRGTPKTSTDALKALISTVQATGGLVYFPDGSFGCAADEEWLDLADAILVAKQALENDGIVVELTITEAE
ncbi:MAG: hypothetical protein ACHQIK_09915 [Candidatus Acidiferrales bacterium]